MHNIRPSKLSILALAFLVSTAIPSSAQTFANPFNFETLVTFDGTNGDASPWHLLQGVDGNFYGSGAGGANNAGTVYQIIPEGALTTLYGEYLHMSVLATDGNFYGTAPYLGPQRSGTVVQLTPQGTLTTLYTFCSQLDCADGESPIGGVIQGSDGNFYGATAAGGAHNYGTVFRITPAGELTTLVSFPSIGVALTALVEGNDGNFYGTTENGGTKEYGTIVRVMPSGWLSTLHAFSGPDGKSPQSALTLGSDGNFYGTTYGGGANNPTLCEGFGCGTIFKITPRGVLTTLHSFCARSDCGDGRWPVGDLLEGTDGNFYGTTQAGGIPGYGTAFKITPEGRLTTLHSFSLDGGTPSAGLLQGTDGAFYGTATPGGVAGGGAGCDCGMAFRLSTGLAPFVKTLPTTGKAESPVTILGNNLLGSTSVTFNGASASFLVISDTEIQATVPTGATTGTVEVTTTQRTLKSNVAFRVAR